MPGRTTGDSAGDGSPRAQYSVGGEGQVGGRELLSSLLRGSYGSGGPEIKQKPHTEEELGFWIEW